MNDTGRKQVWAIAQSLPLKKKGFVFIYELRDMGGTPFYVGQTVSPRKRCKSHFYERKIPFVMKLVEVVPEHQANEKEQFYIRQIGKANRLQNGQIYSERTWWTKLAGALLGGIRQESM